MITDISNWPRQFQFFRPPSSKRLTNGRPWSWLTADELVSFVVFWSFWSTKYTEVCLGSWQSQQLHGPSLNISLYPTDTYFISKRLTLSTGLICRSLGMVWLFQAGSSSSRLGYSPVLQWDLRLEASGTPEACNGMGMQKSVGVQWIWQTE